MAKEKKAKQRKMNENNILYLKPKNKLLYQSIVQ